jgi:colicin import membrane protein
MKKLPEGEKRARLPADSVQSDAGGLLKTGVISLGLHIALLIFLMLNLGPGVYRGGASVYRVTIRPFSPPGNGLPQGGSGPGLQGLPGKLPASVAEKLKPDESFKGSESVARMKSDQKRPEKKAEKSEKGEKLEKEKGSRKSLQEAIEDIHKKVALDEIQKRVARREKAERLSTEGQSIGEQSTQGPIGSSSRSSSRSDSGTGTGLGSGGFLRGGLPGGSPWGSSVLESKLNDYCNMIWTKIKKEWTLPENLLKGEKNLETIIVVIIERKGKIQKSWFEKRSGNVLYDQMAMRAIRKAEPLPPIHKEFDDETFEIGIRFHPD